MRRCRSTRSGLAMAELHTIELHRGAARFLSLLEDVRRQTRADFDALGGEDAETDPRDYRAMAAIVERSLLSGLQHADPRYREGFLRAVAFYLSITVDGCSPCEDWSP